MIIVLSCFYVENIALLSQGQPMDGFSNPVFYLITAAILVMMGIYFFLEHKKNHMKASWVLLPIFSIVFICLTIAIWTNPSSTLFSNPDAGLSATLTYSTGEKIRYTIQLFISIVILYIMMFTFVKGRLRFKKIKWLAYVLIVVVAIASIFSLTFESATYSAIFQGNFSGDGVGSFFINPNIFGLCLMFGILACLLVNFPHAKWWSYIMIFFFFGVMIFTLCNTVLLISSVVIFVYIVARIIIGYIHRHYIRSSIFSLLIVASIISFLIIYLIGVAKQWAFLVAFKSFLERYIFTNNFGNFSNRKQIWSWVIELFKANPLRMILGYGHGASSKLIAIYSTVFTPAVRTCHSGYLEVLLMGGITGFAFYAFGIGFGLYSIIRLFIRKHFRFALLYLMFYLSILLHNVVESTRFFDVSTSGAIIMLLFYLPPIAVWQHLRKPQLVKQAYHNDVWQNSVSTVSVIRVVTLVIVSLIVGLSTSFLTAFPYGNPLVRDGILWALLFLAVNLLFLPYFAALIYKHSSNTRFIVRLIIYGTLLFSLSIGMYLLSSMLWKLNLPLSILLSIAVYLVVGLLLTTIFRFAFKGRFTIWARETVHAAIITPGLAVPFTVIIGGVLTVVCSALFPIDGLTLAALVAVNLLIYYVTFTFVPFKDRKEMSDEFNEEGLFNWRRAVLKDKI